MYGSRLSESGIVILASRFMIFEYHSGSIASGFWTRSIGMTPSRQNCRNNHAPRRLIDPWGKHVSKKENNGRSF